VIARIWRGWAPLATAGDYQRHYQTEVGGHLRAVSGFRGARLLRQQDGQEVMFTSITFFTSLDAVRGFAGDDHPHTLIARNNLATWTGRAGDAAGPRPVRRPAAYP
jgi:heme-degrading monooxygenase HmoA